MSDLKTRYQTFLSFAEILASRSTCKRAKVGAVITDESMLQVLGIGYNGQPRGFDHNLCNNIPGVCGCIHAEINAMIKAPGTVPNKILFTTTTPCMRCAGAILNSGISTVVSIEPYRDHGPWEKLRANGVDTYLWPDVISLPLPDLGHLYPSREMPTDLLSILRAAVSTVSIHERFGNEALLRMTREEVNAFAEWLGLAQRY